VTEFAPQRPADLRDDRAHDLAYDLAHEATTGRARQAGPRPLTAGPVADPGTVDLAGDYGYDSAHDFRR
jgi:hypothetical protein